MVFIQLELLWHLFHVQHDGYGSVCDGSRCMVNITVLRVFQGIHFLLPVDKICHLLSNFASMRDPTVPLGDMVVV